MITANTISRLFRIILLALVMLGAGLVILMLVVALPGSFPACFSDHVEGYSGTSCTYLFGFIYLGIGLSALVLLTALFIGILRYRRYPQYLFWLFTAGFIIGAMMYGTQEAMNQFSTFDFLVILLNIFLALFPPLAYRYVLRHHSLPILKPQPKTRG